MRVGLENALEHMTDATMKLGAKGLAGDVGHMLRHSTSFMEMMGIVVVGWQWLKMHRCALLKSGMETGPGAPPFEAGIAQAAQFWFAAEVPRVSQLATLCVSGETSFSDCKPDWF